MCLFYYSSVIWRIILKYYIIISHWKCVTGTKTLQTGTESSYFDPPPKEMVLAFQYHNDSVKMHQSQFTTLSNLSDRQTYIRKSVKSIASIRRERNYRVNVGLWKWPLLLLVERFGHKKAKIVCYSGCECRGWCSIGPMTVVSQPSIQLIYS